jgi:SnoaL-like domain
VRILDESFGPAARNRLAMAAKPGLDGAHAALESVYYALNRRNLAVLRRVWSNHPLAQLDNPVGGVLRGGDQIARLYQLIFTGPAQVTVTFGDIVEYPGKRHALFAGREVGVYGLGGGPSVPLAIRTSRYFRYDEEAGRWTQVHHHGSIDDPDALHAYRDALLYSRCATGRDR